MSSTGKSYIGQSPTDAPLTSADLASSIVTASKLTASAFGFTLINGTLNASVASNILTIAIKTFAGTDPTAADPVYILFRNSTASTGDYAFKTLSAATSVATTVGGTFGVANSVAFRLWVVAFNDSGTVRLGLINCLTTVAGAGAGRDVTAIYPLSGWSIASSTLIGAGSTSASTFYTSGAGVTSMPYATLGYVTYESGLATMGTFGSAPTRVHLFSRNDALPGQTIQVVRNDTGAVNTGTTVIPVDDTIPQNTEGDQYMTQAITPSSSANALAIKSKAQLSNTAAGATLVSALFQDSTANALSASTTYMAVSAAMVVIEVERCLLASTTSSTTFKTRAGLNTAGTTTFNGASSGRFYAGTNNSFMVVEELMA